MSIIIITRDSVNPVIRSKVRYYLNTSARHVTTQVTGEVTIAATHNKVLLLQREAEHEANPALTAPGDNIRYRVCKLFALVLQSSNCGNVWFM